MLLDFNVYKDKLMGCWMGKNIGGVLGAPFEGRRQINNVDFYIQDLKGNPPPNDDLDLQLVWLNAVEKYGRQVNASILGEYWLSYITPNWVEYGAGKNNLKMGLVPPLSGYMGNPYKDSCGCFIRSEIWACLAPGNPELAARYAYEDAIVDHSDEGMYGEIFCAVLQSAAFVENDKYRLIDIGLSYIPENCGVAKGVKTAIASYKSGADFTEARRNVMTAVPGTFGIQGTQLKDMEKDIPVGKPGWDAPSNIGIMTIGWLYGGDDFGKSLCIAVNCGEDTDCTAATLGAILGIIHGMKGIPEKWIEPIGDTISTCCINMLNGGVSIPGTVTELTDRVLRLTPWFLGREICDILAGPDGYTIKTHEGDGLYCTTEDTYVPGINGSWKPKWPGVSDLIERAPFAVSYSFVTFNAVLDYLEEPYIKVNENRKLKLVLTDSWEFGFNQQWLSIKWHTPDGIKVLPGNECSIFLENYYKSQVELEFEICAEYFTSSKIELLVDITSNGRHTRGIIPVVLIPKVN